VVVASAPVDCVPLSVLLPLQPSDPTQDVASVELQLSVADAPFATLVGFAVSVTVGGGTTVTVAV
jgi:hypothetical protein